jgi:Predicted GTPase
VPGEAPDGVGPGDIVVLSKADLWGQAGLSAATGEGVSALIDRIAGELRQRTAQSSVFTRERHFDKLARADAALALAHEALVTGQSWDLVGEEVKEAIRALDGIIGRVDVEEVLGRIFSSFCIGK